MLSGSSFRPLRSFTSALVIAGVGILAACSTATVTPAATCADADCRAGNKCLPLEGETKCRKTCASNSDPATSCPFGFTCTDTQSGAEPFCIANKAVTADGKPLAEKPGQWGAKCQANLGSENPACDKDQGFFCYGVSPTDGNAYCTRYDCAADNECGAGFWCAKINQTPNVGTAKRSTNGEVQNVCLRRDYCATCKVDLDCPSILGKTQHCVGDANGATFCAPECENNQGCANEARCADAGVGAKVCYPRANVCVGDGTLCSPCRVDTDCGADGLCVKGEYTTERSCAKKTAKCGDCPKTLTTPARSIGCSDKDSENLPANHCVGLYVIGDRPSDLGCWTPDR